MREHIHCILDADHNVVWCDVMTWAKWFDKFDNRRVASDEVPGGRVSTVCMGLDHAYSDDQAPQVFETMSFIEGHDEHVWRYATWDEAVAGHKAVVDAIRNGQPLP